MVGADMSQYREVPATKWSAPRRWHRNVLLHCYYYSSSLFPNKFRCSLRDDIKHNEESVIYHLISVINRYDLSSLVMHHYVWYVSRRDQFISRRHVTIQRVNNKLALHVEIQTLSHVQKLQNIAHSDVAAQLLSRAIPSHQINTLMPVKCPQQEAHLNVLSRNVELS